MGFKKATKRQAKLRASIYGTSGSGKTFTSLRIATGINNVLKSKIGFIDSELGSASKYSDKFEFDVLELENGHKSIDDYIRAIKEAEKEGYQILIIDSLSHAWQELLEEVEKLAQTKFKGNTWSAWSQGTPKQKKLIECITSYNGHIITTMRAKTEWHIGEDKKVRRDGLSPEQGKGIEYEFDFLLEINSDHMATVIKDRSGNFQDQIIKNPNEEFGEKIINWLMIGDVVEQKPIIEPPKIEHLTFDYVMGKIQNLLDSEQYDIADSKIFEALNKNKITQETFDRLENEINRLRNKF
jgi:hypothetical protein